MSKRTVLADVSAAYVESRDRYDRAMRRDPDVADEYLSEMQEIESCVQVIEVSTAWRRTIAKRREREARR